MVKQRKQASPKPTVKRKPNPELLKKLALAILITIFAAMVFTALDSHTESAKNLQKLEQTKIQLNINKQKLQAEIKANTADEAAKQKQIEDLNKKLEETQKQLEAKRASKTAYAASLSATPAPTPAPAAGTTNCGSDPYMAYIYQHESGCRTTALNGIGCYGIGQSCPASKIGHCGADFSCQDAWFRNYAIQRYGSTYGAYQFWLSNHWW